jgi:hypothetical protein
MGYVARMGKKKSALGFDGKAKRKVTTRKTEE